MSVRKLLKLQKESESLVARLQAGVQDLTPHCLAVADTFEESSHADSNAEADGLTSSSIINVSHVSLDSSMLDQHGREMAGHKSTSAAWQDTIDTDAGIDGGSELLDEQTDTAACSGTSIASEWSEWNSLHSLDVQVSVAQSKPMAMAVWHHRQALDMSIALSDVIRESSICSSLALVLANHMKQAEYEVVSPQSLECSKSAPRKVYLNLLSLEQLDFQSRWQKAPRRSRQAQIARGASKCTAVASSYGITRLYFLDTGTYRRHLHRKAAG